MHDEHAAHFEQAVGIVQLEQVVVESVAVVHEDQVEARVRPHKGRHRTRGRLVGVDQGHMWTDHATAEVIGDALEPGAIVAQALERVCSTANGGGSGA